jgi:hypothetical protein
MAFWSNPYVIGGAVVIVVAVLIYLWKKGKLPF